MLHFAPSRTLVCVQVSTSQASSVQALPSSQPARQSPQVQVEPHVRVVQLPGQCSRAPGVHTPVPLQVPQVQLA